MGKKKSGVLLYFNPLHKEALDLNDARCAALFRAVMEYADPETQKDTDFDDETLQHIWTWLKPSLDRDDETYMRKVAGKYANFCRFCKERGYGSVQEGKYVPPLSFQEWEDAGRPTAKQWISVTLDTPDNTNAYESMRTHTNVYEPIRPHTNAYASMRSYAPHENAENRSSDSPSFSDSDSLSDANSVSLSGAGAGADARLETDASPALSPALEKTLEKWALYVEKLKNRPYPPSAREELAARFQSYGRQYGDQAVENLASECMSEGQSVLYWDRLERNARKYMPVWQRGVKNFGTAGQFQGIDEEDIQDYLQKFQRAMQSGVPDVGPEGGAG